MGGGVEVDKPPQLYSMGCSYNPSHIF